jgi:hypothetical protein
MSIFRFSSVAVLAVAASSIAFSQSWNQPWFPTATAGWGPSTIESRTYECYPTKVPKMGVVDDFVATGRVVKRVYWWGTPIRAEQLKYPFLIAFYKNDPSGACKPDLSRVIYQCVQAKAGTVGVDCTGKKIWRFVADLPFWFVGAAREKYWIQISEVDEKSLRPGYVDFKWAFHLRTPNYPSFTSCEALGFDPALTLFSIKDSCTDAKDMAFALYP